MKKCNKCNIQKEYKFFGADKRNKDGLQGTCEECRKINKARRRKEIQAGINIKVILEQICSRCNIKKDINEFYRDSGFSSGYSSSCKQCKDSYVYQWREKETERYNEYMRKYNKKHPKPYNQQRNRLLKFRYGITLEEYNKLLIEQNNSCKMCSRSQNEFKRLLVVDHDHKTGEIRGLLCDGCNTSIAILDNESAMLAAQNYLNKK